MNFKELTLQCLPFLLGLQERQRPGMLLSLRTSRLEREYIEYTICFSFPGRCPTCWFIGDGDEVDHQEVEALHSEIEQLKMELSKAPKNVLHVMPTRNLGVSCGLPFWQITPRWCGSCALRMENDVILKWSSLRRNLDFLQVFPKHRQSGCAKKADPAGFWGQPAVAGREAGSRNRKKGSRTKVRIQFRVQWDKERNEKHELNLYLKSKSKKRSSESRILAVYCTGTMALQRQQTSLQSLSGSRSPGSAWQDSPEVGLGGIGSS